MLAACGSFAPATEPTDGGGAVPADGGAADSATIDGPADGAQPDGAGGSPCDGPPDPQVIFCNDFEAAGAAPFGFQSEDGAPRAAGDGNALAPGEGMRGSTALRTRLTRAAQSRNLWLGTMLDVGPGTYSEIEVQLDFRIVSCTLEYVLFAGFQLWNVDGSRARACFMAAYVDASMLDAVGPSQGPTFATNVVGPWHHGAVRLQHLGGTSFRRVVTIDGATVEDDPTLDFGDSVNADVRIGAFYTSVDDGAVELLFDDVVVRRK